MQFVKKSQAKKLSPFPSTTIFEYPVADDDINAVIAQINGRYPEKGYVINEKSKGLVYVLFGKGTITVEGKEIHFEEGDEILIHPNEKYFWQGHFTILMATTPKWKPEQHKIVK